MNSMQQLWFYGYHLHLDYMLDISYPGMNDDKQFHGEIVAPFSVTLWLYDIWNIQMRLLPLTDDCAFVTVACGVSNSSLSDNLYLLAGSQALKWINQNYWFYLYSIETNALQSHNVFYYSWISDNRVE